MTAFYELHEPPEMDTVGLENAEKWRKEQLRRLWILIGIAFTGTKGPGKRWRMLKCYQILRKRFWRLEDCDWISFIAGFGDSQAIGTVRNKGLQKDLTRIRDSAYGLCQKWNRQVI